MLVLSSSPAANRIPPGVTLRLTPGHNPVLRKRPEAPVAASVFPSSERKNQSSSGAFCCPPTLTNRNPLPSGAHKGGPAIRFFGGTSLGAPPEAGIIQIERFASELPGTIPA